MIAVITYSGVEQGFMFVNFTSDVIKLDLGVRNIGWVMAVFGAVNGSHLSAIASPSSLLISPL